MEYDDTKLLEKLSGIKEELSNINSTIDNMNSNFMILLEILDNGLKIKQ